MDQVFEEKNIVHDLRKGIHHIQDQVTLFNKMHIGCSSYLFTLPAQKVIKLPSSILAQRVFKLPSSILAQRVIKLPSSILQRGCSDYLLSTYAFICISSLLVWISINMFKTLPSPILAQRVIKLPSSILAQRALRLPSSILIQRVIKLPSSILAQRVLRLLSSTLIQWVIKLPSSILALWVFSNTNIPPNGRGQKPQINICMHHNMILCKHARTL